jgi:hypothetical protein
LLDQLLRNAGIHSNAAMFGTSPFAVAEGEPDAARCHIAAHFTHSSRLQSEHTLSSWLATMQYEATEFKARAQTHASSQLMRT